VRPLLLNVGTAVATVVLLGTLSFPASRILTSSLSAGPDKARAAPPLPEPRRLFGVYTDPWHLGGWARAMGARPSLVAKFQSFADRRPIGNFLGEAERQGIRSTMISWEPWRPVPASLGGRAQSQPQLGYRNVDITWGAQDRYIRGFARGLRAFRGTVYLRYAHEMNGFWYPWSADARSYVQAWRRVVRIFRHERVRNVRFVWSVNPSLYVSRPKWRRRLSHFWPGSSYVDYVGSTVINFGGIKHYTVRRFYPALLSLRRMYRKPVILTETNTELRGRVRWLRDLRRMLHRSPWIRAVVWSQLPSRSKVHVGRRVGNVDWDVTKDPPAARVLRRIIEDGSG
jgi:mannan endo-1,4-beta-mannosidase